MYCPNCGAKSKDKEICPKCGEKISNELINYDKKSSKDGLILLVLIIVGVGSLIGFGIYGKNTNLGLLILVLSIVGVFYLLSKKNYSGKMSPCPECSIDRPATDFCIECGHDLKSILGYYKTLGWNRLEITKLGLTIYKKEHDWDPVTDLNIARGVKFFYNLKDIENLQLARCKKSSRDKGYPCIDFDYFGKHVNYRIPDKKINEIDEILVTDTFRSHLEGSYDGFYTEGPFNRK